ncbi:hypothetical protein BD408DRAFT_428294 [Parasitella parasitica]|nr:hypothetical protein BD408DRAFT_428294 [Parasitella parasitica]
MTKELSSSCTIQIDINVLNKNEISADTLDMDIAHPKVVAAARILKTHREAASIPSDDFEHWVESYAGDNDFADLIKTRVAPRKRRSLLSNVSFSYSPDGNSVREDPDISEAPKKPAIPENTLTKSQTTMSTTVLAWLNGLLHRQPKSASSAGSKPLINKTFATFLVPSSKTVIIPNLFKKKQPRAKQKTIPNLPKRYPMPIERVIYEISWIKLNNPRRPLFHHVSISNMLKIVDGRQALMHMQIPARYASSHVAAAVNH